MTTVELLKQAQALISDPENWTKGVYARDEEGYETSAYATDACKWCAVGALHHFSGRLLGGKAGKAFDFLARGIESTKAGVFNFNDRTTHSGILAAYDRAIKLAEKEDTNEVHG